MFQKLIALFLIGLVANPFCCCLASELPEDSRTASCCQTADHGDSAEAENLPAPRPEREPCDCDRTRRQAIVADGQVTTPISLSAILLDLPAPLSELTAAEAPQRVDGIPTTVVPPPGSRFHAQYCVWLI